MASERVVVKVGDGGIGEPVALSEDVRNVFFHLPNGCVIVVEAFVRHGDSMIQVRTAGGLRGAPFVAPRAGNVIAVGVLPDA